MNNWFWRNTVHVKLRSFSLRRESMKSLCMILLYFHNFTSFEMYARHDNMNHLEKLKKAVLLLDRDLEDKVCWICEGLYITNVYWVNLNFTDNQLYINCV